MRALLLSLLSLALLAPHAQAATDSPGSDALGRKAEACVRDHAVEVSRFATSLADGASFLVEDVCARQVEAYNTYRQSEATLAMYRSGALNDGFNDHDTPNSRSRPATLKQQADQLTTWIKETTIDPETGELQTPQGAAGAAGASGITIMASSIAMNRDARFRAVAAEALLAAKAAPASKP